MSNIDDIIGQLSINNINNSGWVNELKEVNFAKNIIDTIRSVLELDDYESNSQRKSYRIAVVKKNDKKWIYRREEGLERLICAVNSINNTTEWGNQIKINEEKCKGKELVDLVEYEKETNRIISLIELKAWNKKDNPLYAIIELLKNYFICDDKTQKYIKNLTLLAPKEYYLEHNLYNNTEFKAFIDKLNSILPPAVTISVKDINLTISDWENKVENKIPNNLDFKKSKSKRGTYDEVADLDLEQCIKDNIFPDITECLQSQNWNSVI